MKRQQHVSIQRNRRPIKKRLSTKNDTLATTGAILDKSQLLVDGGKHTNKFDVTVLDLSQRKQDPREVNKTLSNTSQNEVEEVANILVSVKTSPTASQNTIDLKLQQQLITSPTDEQCKSIVLLKTNPTSQLLLSKLAKQQCQDITSGALLEAKNKNTNECDDLLRCNNKSDIINNYDVDDGDTANVPLPPPFVRSIAQVINQFTLQPSSPMSTAALEGSNNNTDTICDDLIDDEQILDDELLHFFHNTDFDVSANQFSYPTKPATPKNVSWMLSPSPKTSTRKFPTKRKTISTTYKNVNKALPTCRKNTKAKYSKATKDFDWSRVMEGGSSNHKLQELTQQYLATNAPIKGSNETIPPSFIKGKMISTKYGLAMVVVPKPNVTPTEYMNTFSTNVTNQLCWKSPTQLPGTSTTLEVLHQEQDDTIQCNGRLFKHWLKSEDELLQYAISKQVDGPPYMWKELASKFFPNTRSATQCKARWKKIDPQIKKDHFSVEEDTIILQCKNEGLQWPDIAKKLPGRNAEQVRDRFLNTIDPTLMKNVGWTADEEEILRRAQQAMGNKWTMIASLLPGRSQNDVKNHWHNQKLKTKRKIKSIALSESRSEVMAKLRDTNVVNDDVENQQTKENCSVKHEVMSQTIAQV